MSINLIAAFLVPLLCAVFRIGGPPRVVLAFAQTTAFYLSAAWLSIIGLIILGDMVVSSEHLKRRSLDSQLVRLGARLVGFICSIGFLIRGADELGFPAYSVLAGLGVGGLAVALAARDSIANLLGSMLIMLEKPFRVGHIIRVSGSEGTVEAVGFRSTRIRTSDNSLISIPNNAVVNTTIENVSLRAMRRQRLVLQITYDTPREKVEELVAGVRAPHPRTSHDQQDQLSGALQQFLGEQPGYPRVVSFGGAGLQRRTQGARGDTFANDGPCQRTRRCVRVSDTYTSHRGCAA